MTILALKVKEYQELREAFEELAVTDDITSEMVLGMIADIEAAEIEIFKAFARETEEVNPGLIKNADAPGFKVGQIELDMIIRRVEIDEQ